MTNQYLIDENSQLKEELVHLKADLEAYKTDIEELVKSAMAMQYLVRDQNETIQRLMMRVTK